MQHGTVTGNAFRTCTRVLSAHVLTRIQRDSLSVCCTSDLKMLDPVQYLGIHLATGAVGRSRVRSLYVESNVWSLPLQRSYSSLKYFLKVHSNCEHPSCCTTSDTMCAMLFCNQPSAREPYSWHVGKLCEEMGV